MEREYMDDYRIKENNETYLKDVFSLKLPDSGQFESIVVTHYLNTKVALDFDKIDINYLKSAGIELYSYMKNALKEYIEAKFLFSEFRNNEFNWSIINV